MRTGARRPGRIPWLVLGIALLTGCQGVSVWRMASVPRADPAARGASPTSPDLDARGALETLAALLAPPRPLPPDALPVWAETDDDSRDPLGRYNDALEAFLRSTGGRKIRPDAGWCDRLGSLGVRVVGPGEGGAAVWDPGRFDELLFAGDYSVRGMERSYSIAGRGVPLIAVRRFEPDKRGRHPGQERFLMPREVYPVTAVVRAVPAAGDGPGPGSL